MKIWCGDGGGRLNHRSPAASDMEIEKKTSTTKALVWSIHSVSSLVRSVVDFCACENPTDDWTSQTTVWWPSTSQIVRFFFLSFQLQLARFHRIRLNVLIKIGFVAKPISVPSDERNERLRSELVWYSLHSSLSIKIIVKSGRKKNNTLEGPKTWTFLNNTPPPPVCLSVGHLSSPLLSDPSPIFLFLFFFVFLGFFFLLFLLWAGEGGRRPPLGV